MIPQRRCSPRVISPGLRQYFVAIGLPFPGRLPLAAILSPVGGRSAHCKRREVLALNHMKALRSPARHSPAEWRSRAMISVASGFGPLRRRKQSHRWRHCRRCARAGGENYRIDSSIGNGCGINVGTCNLCDAARSAFTNGKHCLLAFRHLKSSIMLRCGERAIACVPIGKSNLYKNAMLLSNIRI